MISKMCEGIRRRDDRTVCWLETSGRALGGDVLGVFFPHLTRLYICVPGLQLALPQKKVTLQDLVSSPTFLNRVLLANCLRRTNWG